MTWVLAALAIVGAYLNARKLRSGFLFWIASNVGWVFLVDLPGKQYARVLLLAVFTSMSAYGWWNWREK